MENNIFRKIWAAGLAENAHAAELEAQASVNDAYAFAMEKCGGAERSPMAYAAHIAAAARKRRQAAELRGDISMDVAAREKRIVARNAADFECGDPE